MPNQLTDWHNDNLEYNPTQSLRWFRKNDYPIGLKPDMEFTEFTELIRRKFVSFVKFVSKKPQSIKTVKFWKWPNWTFARLQKVTQNG